MSWKSKLHKKINGKWNIGDEFTLKEVYKFEDFFEKEYPKNKTVRASIRRNLQEIRDDGYIKFMDKGVYKRIK